MKRILFFLALFAALFTPALRAQVSTPSTLWYYPWPAATATGQVGQYLLLANATESGGPPINYSIHVYVTGTLPSVCTFEVQSSPDGVVWNTGTDTPTGDISCASATDKEYSVAFKPDAYIKINIGTLTGADGTTKVKFFYIRGRNAQ